MCLISITKLQLHSIFFVSLEAGTVAFKIFCVMIPSLVDTSLDFGLFRVVRPHCKRSYRVSPPQMPVQLKRIYNANIPGAEITTFVPSSSPMLHTIIKPELSFFKNCFENGMLTSCVLSYVPMLVNRFVLPRSPEIFLRPFPEKT